MTKRKKPEANSWPAGTASLWHAAGEMDAEHPRVALALRSLADAVEQRRLAKLERLLSEAEKYARTDHGVDHALYIASKTPREAYKRALEAVQVALNGLPRAEPALLRELVEASVAIAACSIDITVKFDEESARSAWRKRWLTSLNERLIPGKGANAGKVFAPHWDARDVLDRGLVAAGVTAKSLEFIEKAEERQARRKSK